MGVLTLSASTIQHAQYFGVDLYYGRSTNGSYWDFLGHIESGGLVSGETYSVSIEIPEIESGVYYYMIGVNQGMYTGGPFPKTGGTGLDVDLTIDGTPLEPTNLVQTESSTTTFLTWTAPVIPSNSNISGLIGYNIYRSPSGMDPIKLNTTPVTTTSYSVPKPANNTPYATDIVFVKAVDGTNNQSLQNSNEIQVKFRGSELESTENPDGFTLLQNYPNPFNPVTLFRYFLPSQATVTISVFDIQGKRVFKEIIQNSDAGFHSFEFNGDGFAAGSYLLKLDWNGQTQTKRMQLIK